MILWQDNNSKHKPKLRKDWLQKKMKVLQCLSQCADLNPIKINLWND